MRTLPRPSAWLVLGLLAVALPSSAQSPEAGTIYRVFLSGGQPLPSYGEPAVVGDRVIFNLIVGPVASSPELQLVSLPAAGVDVGRTTRYSDSMRAAQYKTTRGEAEYAAITAEVARALDQLSSVSDRQKRLALAEEARRRLLAWSDEHYQYRREDIRELSRLFDDVINELRIAVGAPALSFALVADTAQSEALLAPPTLRETVELALVASKVADVGEERVAILRKVSRVAARADAGLGKTVAAQLAQELRAGTAYAALISALRLRADAAKRRGDPVAIARAREELDRRDRQLGERRPLEVSALRQHLDSILEATREFRRALAEYTRQRVNLRGYDRRVQPLLVRVKKVEPVLSALREMQGVTVRQLTTVDTELRSIGRALALVKPPRMLSGMHATLQSALQMGRQSALRRRQAKSSQSVEMREASAAAAGALLLTGQARRDLAASLRRPTIQ